MSKMWMDASCAFCACGDVAFVLEVSPQGKADYYVARQSPGRTNRSNEARLTGWLGETNNVNTDALGVWEVVRQAAANGDRIEVRKLDGAELLQALEELGYPELAPEPQPRPGVDVEEVTR
jgi:hypothetical protein